MDWIENKEPYYGSNIFPIILRICILLTHLVILTQLDSLQ